MKSSFTRGLRSVRPVTWKPNMRSGGLKDMKVVGIDLTGSEKRASGVAALVGQLYLGGNYEALGCLILPEVPKK
jgi:hypothetical protein